jgi:hypothetical protein
MTNSVISQAKKQGFKPAEAPQQATPQQSPQQPTGNLPTLAKVSQQHAIARTKADITAVQTIAAKRTQIVLQAFDEAMADSDADIIAALEQRLGGDSDGFFGFDLEQEFAALLAKPDSPEAIAPATVEVLTAAQLA